MTWEFDEDDVYQTEPRVKNDIVCEIPGEDFPECRKAWPQRAPILAAAPDLLEALEAMVECYATPTAERSDYLLTAKGAAVKARAAIAKAKVRP